MCAVEDGIGDVMGYVSCDEESEWSAAAVEASGVDPGRGFAAQSIAGLLSILTLAMRGRPVTIGLIQMLK